MRTETIPASRPGAHASQWLAGVTHATADIGTCAAGSLGEFASTAFSGLLQLSASAATATFSAVDASADSVVRHQSAIESIATPALGLACIATATCAAAAVGAAGAYLTVPVALARAQRDRQEPIPPEVAQAATEVVLGIAMGCVVVLGRLATFGQAGPHEIGEQAGQWLDRQQALPHDERLMVGALIG